MDTREDSLTLKVKTRIIVPDAKEIDLRFPACRISRDLSKLEGNVQVLDGFHGRIQTEFNSDPVGQFAGPYDQNEKLDLKLQLPDADLNFEQYTEFQHTGSCQKYRIGKSYDSFGDLEKIDSIEVDFDEESDSDSEDEESDGDSVNEDVDDDKITYTCEKKRCKIPCPCLFCYKDGEQQCSEHWVKHQDVFDEQSDVVVARTTDAFCKDETFFTRSYLCKYSGIPLNCVQCKRDLLHHKSYHFDFHYSCKFCMQNWFKLYPESEEEFVKKQKKEEEYFKTVCPYCNKILRDHNARKKHVQFEHKKKPYQCGHCEKTFHAKQSMDYHELVFHAPSASLIKCDVCEKRFSAQVSLRNHQTYVHSENRRFECEDCDIRFKQKKDLRAHNLHVHDIDQTKERYHKPVDKVEFKCNECGKTYKYRKDLNAHTRLKHEEEVKLYECEQCDSKFKQKKLLNKHVKTLHGGEEFPCPTCGKVFNQKSNMKRHSKMHEEDE